MSARGTRRLSRTIALGVVLALVPAVARAEGGHGDPVATVALSLALFLVVAKIGGDLAVRLRQPAVLGELVAGVLLGNLGLVGVHALEPIKTEAGIDLLSRLGMLILLFEIGLESTVEEMLAVGPSSFLVATLGVAAPFALGWGVGALLLPDAGALAHVFLGATLSATSVGITARVLKDLQKSKTLEARIILGAAVIDDVLGLVLLALVTGFVAAAERGGALGAGEIALILAKAIVFLVGALVVGRFVSPRIFRAASRLQSRGVLVSIGLAGCFALSWVASRIGLASIVGAFAAGLVLEDIHYRSYANLGKQPLEALIQPISSLLVPVFFVLMGMRTDLRALSSGKVLLLAAALTVAAVIGKQVCGLGALGRGVDRLTIGLGMIPRGEVGLIFANIGLGLTLHGRRVIDEPTFAALVVMVMATTLATPPALGWAFRRQERG